MGDQANERQPLLENCGPAETRLNAKAPNVQRGGFLAKRQRQKALEKYYGDQRELIDLYEQDAEMLEEHSTRELIQQGRIDRKDQLKWDKRFALLIFFSNIVIFSANLAASILSMSFSIISVLVDSTVDLTTSIVVYFSIWAIKNTDKFKYPRGRHRLEVMAVIGCSIFMGVANLMLIIRSIEAIVTNKLSPDANWPTIVLMVVSIVIKLIIMVICYRHGSKNSRMLALDQRNDALSSAVGLAGAYIGDKFWIYADPVGAILISAFVAISWFWNAVEHVPLIVGRRVQQCEFSRVLAIALKHDERIMRISHVFVYHVGEQAQVEIHIVLAADMALHTTHRISETLRDKLTSLNFVERAFVHVECEK